MTTATAAAARPARSARAPRPAATLSAYVLHHWDWSESSLVLDLFTREQGRIAVVARGAKRPYSQLRPVLMPFQRIHVTLGRPRAAPDGESGQVPEVQTLRGAEWAGGTPVAGGAALFAGFHCNELLLKLLARHDSHPRLFDAYAETLPVLGDLDAPRVQAALRAFELVLLRQTGLLPDLSRVTATQTEVRDDERLSVLGEHGVTRLPPGEAGLPGAALVQLEAALDHGSPAALRQACAGVLAPLRSLLRGLLAYHLGTPVLRTRQVMQSLQDL